MRYKKGPFFTLTFTLIMINIGVFFLVLLLLPIFGEKLIYNIGVRPIDILQGKKLWTLVTNMFVHVNPRLDVMISHLLVNMLSLYFLGTFLERLIGKKRFIFVYLVSGIVASLFFVFFASAKELESVAVGASGAIFGIAGVLAVLTPKVPVYIMFIPIPIPLWLGVIFILTLLWIVSVIANLPIANFAHLGGLIAGALYGFYLRKKHARKIALLDRIFRRFYSFAIT